VTWYWLFGSLTILAGSYDDIGGVLCVEGEVGVVHCFNSSLPQVPSAFWLVGTSHIRFELNTSSSHRGHTNIFF
jgi:hypothetical protein